VELDANNDNSIINLANCYGMLGQYQTSIATAQKLLDRSPNNVRALENIAFTYKLMGNMQKHEEYLERANANRK
jgi:tetratricopeptide (TPR) repeat protein